MSELTHEQKKKLESRRAVFGKGQDVRGKFFDPTKLLSGQETRRVKVGKGPKPLKGWRR